MFGLCFFTIVVLLGLDVSPVFKIAMMSGLFFIPASFQLFDLLRSSQCASKKALIFLFALMLEIGGVVILMTKVGIVHQMREIFLTNHNPSNMC